MYMSCKFRLAEETLRYIRVDIVRGLSNVFLTDPIQGVCERERERESVATLRNAELEGDNGQTCDTLSAPTQYQVQVLLT